MNLAAEVVKIDLWEVYAQFNTVVALGTEIIGPLMLGSVIVGLVAAVLTYLLSITLIHTFLRRRRNRQRLDNR
jgi:hypothetical protein